MMDFIKKNMVLLLGILGIFLALVVYLNFFSGENTAALLAVNADSTSPVSQELLTTLTNLHTIKLDTTIFSSPVFLSLTPFGVEIPPESVGRRNPFLPVGSQ
jgi:hypothetical protein